MVVSDAASIVNNTSLACAPSGSRLGGTLLWSAFSVLNKVHQVWWWYRRKEVYSNPDNFLKLAAGQTINWFAGNNIFIRIAAQTVLISTRILECIEEQVALCKEMELLWQGVAGTDALLPPKVKWIKSHKSNFLSPSTRMYWRRMGVQCAARLWRVGKCTLLIIRRLFILSMRTMDAIGAFSYNAATKHEAVGEFFVNCSKWVNLLISNKKMMMTALTNNRAIIASVLKSVNSPITAQQLINGVRRAVEATEKVNEKVQGVSQVVGMVAKDLFQRSMFGLFQTFGLASYVPGSWVPPLRPPWIDALDAPPNERFPTFQRVQLSKI